jgi:hypothetical protein
LRPFSFGHRPVIDSRHTFRPAGTQAGAVSSNLSPSGKANKNHSVETAIACENQLNYQFLALDFITRNVRK